MDTQALARMEELLGHSLRATHEILVDLEKARAALESFINDMVDACALVTGDGHVVWGNRAAAELLGTDEEALHKEKLDRLFKTEAWAKFLERMREAKAADEAAPPLVFELPIGEGPEQKEYSWHVRPFRAVSERRGGLYLVVGRDVTNLLRERTQKVRLESELETAKLVQDAFFPPRSIDLKHLKIASYYEPAERCSGDWWGKFTLGENLELVCIADVTGHGAAAALITAMVHSCCATLSQLIKEGGESTLHSTGRLLTQLNRVLCESMKTTLNMTFFAALFDLEAGVLRFSNAGHHFPLLLPRAETTDDRISLPGTRPGTAVSRNKQYQPLRLVLAGDPLGQTPGLQYGEQEVPLKPGDRLILYTDGLVECTSPDGTPWGKRNFLRAMLENVTCDTTTLLGNIVKEAKKHFGPVMLDDDITLVVAEVAKSWPAKLVTPGVDKAV